MNRTSPTDQLDNRLSRWTWAIVCVGILLRVFRFILALPMNGDEARVGLNIIQRGYRDLLHPLNYAQVAPVGFLWGERAFYQMLGMSEYAMRLLPLLVGIAALLLFAIWARLLLRPPAAFIAIGILAVGQFVVQHAVEMKPYGFDLLTSLLLLVPATLFLLRRQDRWLGLLIVLAPLTLAFSYPIAFIAGAIAVTLGLQLPQMSWRSRSLVALFGLVLAGGFLLVFLQISNGQYQQTNVVMNEYWKNAFPPRNFLKLLVWLVDVHTGNLFSYPIGGKNFGSTGSFLLFLCGIYFWISRDESARATGVGSASRTVLEMPENAVRSAEATKSSASDHANLVTDRRGPVIWLALLPFLFTLIAAALHRYPYGQSERCGQHLAPAIALLMGVGGAGLLERFAKTSWMQFRAAGTVFIVLLLLAVGVLINNTIHPGTREHFASREIAQSLLRESSAGATIAVLEPRDQTTANVQWYLCADDRVIWNAGVDTSWQHKPGKLVVVTCRNQPGTEAELVQELGAKPDDHRTWRIAPIGDPEEWDAYIFSPRNGTFPLSPSSGIPGEGRGGGNSAR
jgi:4-amino-4-deoxy-L-arabinose transferase-like glycosyltransferase